MEAKNEKWKTESGQRIWMTDDKEFLIFPEALEYCGLKRGALRMQLERNLTEGVDYFNYKHYVMVSKKHCDEIRNLDKISRTVKDLEKKHQTRILPSDLEAFMEWRKEQKEKETKPDKK